MTSNLSFRVVDNDLNCVAGPVKTLREAILAAARHDGYGACFERMDSEGHIHPTFPMRLFSSRRHIGNNPYFPSANDAFAPESKKTGDVAAQDEVALEVFLRGVLHSKYLLNIEALNASEQGVLADAKMSNSEPSSQA